jgi:hypothetical protein
MTSNKIMIVENININVKYINGEEFICLTDMAKSGQDDKRAADVIKNWIRNRGTLEFLGVWEKMYNKNFKVVEFDHLKSQAGLHNFVLSPGQWIEKTEAIGILVQKGKYGGTYAHKDIAFEFGSAISSVFRLLLIKEYERLKESELRQQSLEWDLSRTLAKINYKIHTDAVKEYLIPPELTKEQINRKYADEADVLNVALFGTKASDWRKLHPQEAKTGNIRDFAPLEHLIVLSNLESINAMLINDGLEQSERLVKLNNVARRQMLSLVNDGRIQEVANKQLLSN